MALMAGGRGGIPRELQRFLSLIGYGSTGGVCGRSLTEGEILFTGRQTCSLYSVLWLCGPMLSCKIFWRGSNKNYRIDDTMIKAIRPPFLHDILVFN